jgi:Outer membrane protein beta-barrel domain
MKGKACGCYRFTVSKLIIMKTRFIKLRGSVPRLLLQISVTGFFIFLLESCVCYKYCYNNLSDGGPFLLSDKHEDLSDKPHIVDCFEICEMPFFRQGIPIIKLEEINSFGSRSDESTSATPVDDSVASVGTPIPTKKSPGRIGNTLPGEYYATTITAGPLLNFKSSNEEYGGGYGKHEPGVGFNVGVGTVLPFNKHWALAPSLRFTQKNASEKISYSGTGGGTMETYIDKYSYSYVGGTMLAQYRAGKHVSFVAGPEVNFLMAASVKNGGSSGTGEKQSLSKSSNKIGVDLLAGIKFEIPAKSGRSKWGLQLMYDHRLSRLNKKKDETGQDIPAYKMKGFQLGLAYNICGSCGKKK